MNMLARKMRSKMLITSSHDVRSFLCGVCRADGLRVLVIDRSFAENLRDYTTDNPRAAAMTSRSFPPPHEHRGNVFRTHPEDDR